MAAAPAGHLWQGDSGTVVGDGGLFDGSNERLDVRFLLCNLRLIYDDGFAINDLCACC